MHFCNLSVLLVAIVVGSGSTAVAVPVLDTLGSGNGLAGISGIVAELTTGGNLPIVGGVGGGLLGGVRRTTPAPEYIDSAQTETSNSCNVGMAQCCQSLHQTSDFRSQQALGGLLSAAIPLDNLMVGLQCQPILGGLLALSGSKTCSSQPVCCSGNTYEGLINLGCSPISL